jgi:hypothetical protein
MFTFSHPLSGRNLGTRSMLLWEVPDAAFPASKK